MIYCSYLRPGADCAFNFFSLWVVCGKRAEVWQEQEVIWSSVGASGHRLLALFLSACQSCPPFDCRTRCWVAGKFLRHFQSGFIPAVCGLDSVI